MGAALMGVDRVGKGVHRLGVGVVPLHGDLEADPPVVPVGLERDHRGVHRLLAAGQVTDVVDQPSS